MARTAARTTTEAEPTVTAVDAGGDDAVTIDASAQTRKPLSLDDPASLYAVLVHHAGCPQEGGSMDANGEGVEGEGWAHRMEAYPAEVPPSDGYPRRTVHLVRCLDCGSQVRIDNL